MSAAIMFMQTSRFVIICWSLDRKLHAALTLVMASSRLRSGNIGVDDADHYRDYHWSKGPWYNVGERVVADDDYRIELKDS